jgi:riboflavin biosynthesis pyrimidine reductase
MPDRLHANRGAPIETLFEAPAPDGPVRGGDLPPDLHRYGARLVVPLRTDRPAVLVNFVESLDGVVTFDPEHGSGAEISGFSEPDRFVMGLLRALADAIVVGAGTMRAAPNHAWTPRHVSRSHADAYAAWRRHLGLAPEPTTIVVTATGNIPADHPALATPGVPAIVVTTADGKARLRGSLPPQVRVIATGEAVHVSAGSILAIAQAEGARVVLCEGGPHLIGTFVAERLVDELFLTLAPQLVGRRGGGDGRYSLVEGITLGMEEARWGRLRSIRRSVDHLFLRYAFDGAAGPVVGI